jgi:calnexin
LQPKDWDEDAPLMITDTAATKPDDWLEDEPEMIPDPEAEKPEEWDVSYTNRNAVPRAEH